MQLYKEISVFKPGKMKKNNSHISFNLADKIFETYKKIFEPINPINFKTLKKMETINLRKPDIKKAYKNCVGFGIDSSLIPRKDYELEAPQFNGESILDLSQM